MSFPGFPAPPGPGVPPSLSTHELLSATHSDTNATSGILGDVIVAESGGIWSRKAVGTEGQIFTVVSGVPDWIDSTAVSATGIVISTIVSGVGAIINIGSAFVTLLPSGTVQANLPGVPASGQRHLLKDAAGVAGASPIVVSGLNSIDIDGAATQSIAANYGSLEFIYGGIEWHII